jgi:hypothetical protein
MSSYDLCVVEDEASKRKKGNVKGVGCWKSLGEEGERVRERGASIGLATRNCNLQCFIVVEMYLVT